jgi:hypothetical protein
MMFCVIKKDTDDPDWDEDPAYLADPDKDEA